MNWNAIPPDHPAYPAYGRVSLEQQAEYVALAYRRAQLEWPWIGVVNLWYFKRATDAERDQPMYYFRMVEPDFTPMSVYEAVTTLTHSAPVLGLGLHQEDDWALTYEGDWVDEERDAAQLGRVRTSESGSLSFRWRGTDLTLTGYGPAELSVRLDSGPERTYRLGEGPGEVRLASTADRVHELSLRVTGGRLLLDSLAVRQTPRRQGLLALTVSAVGVAAVALTFAWRRRPPRR
jgi:hypothetical protein